MRQIRWVRQFGLKTAFEMEQELWRERLARVLLKAAHLLDPQMQDEHERNEYARRVAFDLVYGRVDGAEAARKFYGIYY